MLSVFVILQGRLIQDLRRDDHGASSVEYGLLVALITAVIIAAVAALGTAVKTVLTNFVSVAF